jgi:hypothetical protein
MADILFDAFINTIGRPISYGVKGANKVINKGKRSVHRVSEKIKKEKAYALKLKRDLTKLRKQLKHSQKEISTKLVTKPKRKKPKKKRRK